MVTEIKTTESGNAGKPGEPTAGAHNQDRGGANPNKRPDTTKAATVTTSAGITELLSYELQQPDAGPSAKEVQPKPGDGDENGNEQPNGTEHPPETPKGKGDEGVGAGQEQNAEGEEPDAGHRPDATAETDATDEGALPEHLDAELKQWEESGGALPPPLQKLVERRIGKVVKAREEAEAKALAHEATIAELQGQLDDAQANGRPAPNPTGGLTPELLDQSVKVARQLVGDVRAMTGEYATEDQRARLDKYAKSQGLDDAGLRRMADQWGEWLRDEVPQLRQNVTQFKALETEVGKVVNARFPGLARRDSEEAKWAKEIQQIIPDLATRTAGHRQAIGLYALGKIAWDHLAKASESGDVIAALKEVLTKHVPLPATGANGKATNGNGKANANGALNGKAPPKAAVTAGRPLIAPRQTSKDAEADQRSEELRKNPTRENVTAALAGALRLKG